jgi:predicted ferric reductase
MSDKTKATLWVVVYFLLLFIPFIVLFIAPRPSGREFWREFAVGLGFAGLSLIGMQFLLPARIPFITEVFRLRDLNDTHHNLSLVGLVLIAAHVVILLLHNPRIIRSLLSIRAAWPIWGGVISLFLMIIIVIASVWQSEINISHQPWRVKHIALSILGIVLVLAHIFGVSYYLSILAHRIVWIILAILWACGVVIYAWKSNMGRAVDSVAQGIAERVNNKTANPRNSND